ncbi:MAG: hypothetical protein QOI47_49 [Actinomycetota bacterium]|nr:hypothetical protein [Actinomycetota bacterium]
MQSWLVRLSWLAIPFTAGSAIADALGHRSSPVQVTAAVLLWSGWAAVVVGLLVPRPAGLVGVRVGAVAAALLVVWAADSALDWWVAGSHAVVMLALALAPETGEWLVNGTAYGYERRYLLRPPGALVAGPLALSSVALPAAVLTGPLLLASHQWVAGAVAIVLGAPLAFVLARALHSVAVRWAVLVPAGFVLKDHLSLLDPVLFRRTDIEVLRAAPADTNALDLTAGALGLALELRLRGPQRIDRMRPVRRGAEPYEADALLCTPTRPRALLADAASRRIRVDAMPPPKTASPS